MSANTQKRDISEMLLSRKRSEKMVIMRSSATFMNILNEMIEEHKEEPEPLQLDKTDVRKVFEQSGVSSEKVGKF